jgi:hypothetical protein
MRSGVRWLMAGLVTAATFSATLWVSEALVLPLWIKSDADRWVVAGALGAALSALAAVWGASFAQRADKRDKSKEPQDVADPQVDSRATNVSLRGDAVGHGRVYQAGHDQTINEK